MRRKYANSSRHLRRSFTLAELILAGIITAFLMGSIASSLTNLAKAKLSSRQRLEAHLRADAALEMIRGLFGDDEYLASLKELFRVLRPGGVLGLAEPMHRGGPPPADLDPLVSDGPIPFKSFLATPEHTVEQFREAGFEVTDSGHAPDARAWWEEFAAYDDECKRNPDGNPRMLTVDAGRWISFGYVIGRRPR